MTFSEKYGELEHGFQEQVERDNTELGIESSYLPNFVPLGRVDYVLIAMEPSTGVPGKYRKYSSQMARNFSWSVEDFIFHYSIREYLCQKSAMTIDDAKKHRQRRYERWYPLLEKELQLLTKPEGTRVIAVGNEVTGFFKKKPLGERMEKVRHYSRLALSSIDKAIQRWHKQFPEFSRSVDNNVFKKAFEKSIKDVLTDADMYSYINHRPEGDGTYRLTEPRKKLMFYYKNRFSELGACPSIRSWRRQPPRNNLLTAIWTLSWSN